MTMMLIILNRMNITNSLAMPFSSHHLLLLLAGRRNFKCVNFTNSYEYVSSILNTQSKCTQHHTADDDEMENNIHFKASRLIVVVVKRANLNMIRHPETANVCCIII